MNRLLSTMLLGATIMASSGNVASAATAPTHKGQSQVPGSRMHKAQPVTQKWSAPQSFAGQRQQRVSSHFTTSASDSFECVYAPDGSIWYAVTDYDTEEIKYEYYTEHDKKGFTITFFDSKFNEIGKVRDKIEFQDNETRCVQVSLGSQITQKFFNYDSKYEVMVSLFMNTPEYVTNSRTLAYSITQLEEGENSTPITVLPGYPVDEVNCARDRWSEEFYITFLNEEQAGDPDNYESYIDFLGDYRNVLTTYGKEVKQVMEKKIRLLDLPGDQMSSPMMVCKNEDGHLVLVYASYEKSFFENPAGQSENEKVTEDNRLIIETYRMNDAYPREMELLCTTKIDTKQNTENQDVYCTYYGIGNLMYDKDVDFDNYTSDGRPAFIVSADDYLFSDDDHYNSSYYVYDTDGNHIHTIAENTYDYVMMSDLPGFEPQAMFIHMGDDMNFEFVDLYSCKKVTEIDHMYRGYSLSISLDRVASGDGYVYASALSTGLPIDDTHLAAPVCWIDSTGEFIRLDKIPTGEGVELAQIYMNSDGLKPFVFNTDNDIEYMMLVKRNIEGRDALREELLIASVEKGVIHSFTDDDVKGELRSVMLIDGMNPELLIVYLDNKNKYTADAYSLPFNKFSGGTGTAADPYMIATGGDLQQIKSDPAAYYKLSNDIDCDGMDFYPIAGFSGTLDGDGHSVNNLRLVTHSNSTTGIFSDTYQATVKNLNFYNAKMLLSGSHEAGLIAATAGNSVFDNIHVRRLTATGNDFSGEFGGLVGKMWTKSSISGCEVAAADIDLPSCPDAGGMTGDIRTGCTITSCACSGNMTANSTLGGIVGTTTTGDEVISFCHVDANLKAENTVGGIVGFLDRSKVKSNYVEGTIEATKPSKWTNAVALGGIAGDLEGDWQGKADVPVVNNLIGVSALIYPDLSNIQEQHPRQLNTVHRVVGRSSYNYYYEDEPGKIVYESGVLNNLIVSDLAVIDEVFAEKTIEGLTTDKNEIEQEMLQKQLGFEYGTTTEAPWNIQSWYDYDPSLYYENTIYIPTPEIKVKKGDTFSIEVALLTRQAMSEDDLIGDFMCEFPEQMLEMTNDISFNGKVLTVGFKAIKEGDAKLSVTILGGTAGCDIKVITSENAVESITSTSGNLAYASGTVTACGSAISVYDIHGKLHLSGKDAIDVSSLHAGVYVAVASDENGKNASIKFVK